MKMKKMFSVLLALGMLASTAAITASASAAPESLPQTASASPRIGESLLNDMVPMKAYARYSRNDVYSSIGGSSIGWFDNVDPVTITGFSGQYASVSYQTSSGATKIGWTQSSNFSYFEDDTIAWVFDNQTVYTNSSLSTSFGYVSTDAPFYVVSAEQNSAQIIYALDNGTYKLAWLPSNAYFSVSIGFGQNVKAYTYQTGQFTTYTAPGTPGYTASGWVDNTDEIIINTVYTNGWCKITYPLSAGGTKTAYCLISIFTPNNTYRSNCYVEQNTNVLNRPTGSYYGYVDNTESFVLVGQTGNYSAIVYKTGDGTKKMGWIPNSSIIYR